MNLRAIILAFLLISGSLHAAPPSSEAEAHAYRQAMQSANRDLQAGKAQAAFETIKAQAEKGYAEAQYILATLYHDGEGTEQDMMLAALWYQKAAEQNYNSEIALLAREALAELGQH